MEIIRKIPAWVRNKYFVTFAAFTVWMLFFDEQDLVTTHVKSRRELHKLEASRDYYLQQINETRQELTQLRSNPAILEKYAREKYRMKRDNEDLFIIPQNSK